MLSFAVRLNEACAFGLQVVLRLRQPKGGAWAITRALRSVAAWPLSQARTAQAACLLT